MTVHPGGQAHIMVWLIFGDLAGAADPTEYYAGGTIAQFRIDYQFGSDGLSYTGKNIAVYDKIGKATKSPLSRADWERWLWEGRERIKNSYSQPTGAKPRLRNR